MACQTALSPAELALIADVAVTTWIGLEDFDDFEAPVEHAVVAAVTGVLALVAVATVAPWPIVVASLAAVELPILYLVLSGRAGYGDLLVGPRVAVVAALSAVAWAPLAAYIVASVVAYLHAYRVHVVPALCPGKHSWFGPALVRCDALSRKNVLPPGTPVEDDDAVEEAKEKATAECRGCTEAYVGLPMLYVMAQGYLAAVVAYVALIALF